MGTSQGDRTSPSQRILERMLVLIEKREEFDRESVKAVRELTKAGGLKDKAKVTAALEEDER